MWSVERDLRAKCYGDVATDGSPEGKLESRLWRVYLAVPGEGERGCLFDEIQNLVEPIERSARGVARDERRFRKYRLVRERSRIAQRNGLSWVD
jgi:hypothetical protein